MSCYSCYHLSTRNPTRADLEETKKFVLKYAPNVSKTREENIKIINETEEKLNAHGCPHLLPKWMKAYREGDKARTILELHYFFQIPLNRVGLVRAYKRSLVSSSSVSSSSSGSVPGSLSSSSSGSGSGSLPPLAKVKKEEPDSTTE